MRLVDGETLALQRSSSRISNGNLIWRGKLDPDSGLGESGDALLVVGRADAAGWIRTKHRLWRLEPRDRGGHLLLEIDPAGLTNVDDAAFIADQRKRSLAVIAPPAETAGAKAYPPNATFINTLVVFDQRLGLSSSARLVKAELAVDSTNMAFEQSGLTQSGAVRLTLNKNTLAMNVISTNVPQQRQELMANSTVAAARNAGQSDIVMLISYGSGAVCGVAAASLQPTAAEAYAVAADNLPCDYTFEHEAAHLLSAGHDAGQPPAPSGQKSYAYAFTRFYPGDIEDSDYITLMTYKSEANCPGNLCERKHQFSNPDVFDQYGYRMGSSTKNNARAMTEEAARVAAFR